MKTTELSLPAIMNYHEGRIVKVTKNRKIHVAIGDDSMTVSCAFLRTSAFPQPVLNVGDMVLTLVDENNSCGYVMGIIEDFNQPQNGVQTTQAADSTNVEHSCKQIKFNAEERIEFECGAGRIVMDKDGKIILRGKTITTRARGVNKVKGGSVQIN